jgi:hypothetical protein
VSTFKVGSTFTFKIPITNYQNDANLVQNFDSEEEIKEMHPNKNLPFRSSFGEELSKDIEGLKDDQENTLFKQLLKLD